MQNSLSATGSERGALFIYGGCIYLDLSTVNVLISDKVTGTIRNDAVSLDSHYAPAERDMLLPVPHGYLNLSESVAR